MEVITSLQNDKIKAVIKLYDKKHRDKTGLFIVEGLKWIADALTKDRSSCEQILVKESQKDKLLTELKPDNALESKILILQDNVFDKVSQLENTQGILAVLKIKHSASKPLSSHCLFLDRVRDPGNLGTIIRTACAAGYTDIILYNCVDVYNPKVIRSCMSAILNINIFFADYEIFNDLKKDGYAIVTADLNGENVFSKTDFPSKLCLVIGNEADGISGEVKVNSDLAVKIPMNDIESLNAAVSAGILMYTLKAVR